MACIRRRPRRQTVKKTSFSVLLPYYNEVDYLAQTLTSWLQQSHRPGQIILVDNGSTDGSESIARSILEKAHDIRLVYLQEPRPGKVHALEIGCQAIDCEFVAMSDADTYYPPHYLKLCEQLFAKADERVAALMALPEAEYPEAFLSKLRRHYFIILHRLFNKHAFTGGYGQVFRTKSLLQAGGYTEKQWPHVLMDHEIMYRIFQFGLSEYHKDLWCQSSLRRHDRKRVRWNLLERILYILTPHSLQGWFFYSFLDNRFAKRGLNHLRLREKPWQLN